jgi:uncharacterized protein
MHPAVLELKKQLLEKYPNQIVRFMVFGSYARGEQTSDSDIDVLVTFSYPVNWELEREIINLAYDIELENDVLLDLKIFFEADIQNTLLGATPLIENVMKEGIQL